jgi:hypothetical protein
MPFWYAITLVFAILQMLIMRAAPAARWLSCAAAILLALIVYYCSHDSLAGSN